MEPTKISTNAELAAIREGRSGFIYQDWTVRGAETSGNLLHWAGCRQVARMLQGADPLRRPSVTKLYFEALDDAVAWLMSNRGDEDDRWGRCEMCKASPAPVTHSAPGTVPEASGAPAVFREAEVEEALYGHLERQGYSVQRGVRVASGIIDAVATNAVERIVIEAKGEDRGATDRRR